MHKLVRVEAVLAPELLRTKSYDGEPQTWAQLLELTQEDGHQLLADLRKGVPLVYEHDEATELGRVVDASVRGHPPALHATLEFSTETPAGESTLRHVIDGTFDGVSLSHLHGQNKVLHVAACKMGARGPGARMDTKSLRYISPANGRLVQASSLLPHSVVAPSPVHAVFRIVAASLLPVVPATASNMSAPVHVQSTPVPTPSYLPPNAAAPAAAQPTSVAEIKPKTEVDSKQPEEDEKADAEEEKDAMTDIPAELDVSRQVQTMLAAKIPTDKARSDTMRHVLELEMQKKTLEERLRQAEEDKKRATAEGEHTHRMFNDLVKTYSRDAPKTMAIMASASEQQRTEMESMLKNADERSRKKKCIDDAAMLALEAWKKQRRAEGRPVEESLVDAGKQPVAVHASYANAPAPDVFSPDYGRPMARPPDGFAVAVHASALSAGTRKRRGNGELALPDWEPGAGLNFDYGVMEPMSADDGLRMEVPRYQPGGVLLTPDQASVLMSAPRTKAQIGRNVELSKIGASAEWINTRREIARRCTSMSGSAGANTLVGSTVRQQRSTLPL